MTRNKGNVAYLQHTIMTLVLRETLPSICSTGTMDINMTAYFNSSITKKMQRYTMVFITINALHVSGASSAHHQELKTI
jgi:hypothetical protein